MKNIVITICMLLGISVFYACDKEDDFTHPTPSNWQVNTTDNFNTTMTAVVVLPENLLAHAQDNDKVVAFMEGVCRGEGKLVKVGEQRYYFLTIKGYSDEQGEIAFKYYNTNRSFLYETESTLSFEPDGNWGNLDNPKVLKLKGIK